MRVCVRVCVCFPFLCTCISLSLYTQYPQPMCVCVCMCVSVITHQVHSGGGITQGHADPGGCVSDDLMIHPLQSDFIFFYAPEGPDANFDWPHPAGCCYAVLSTGSVLV